MRSRIETADWWIEEDDEEEEEDDDEVNEMEEMDGASKSSSIRESIDPGERAAGNEWAVDIVGAGIERDGIDESKLEAAADSGGLCRKVELPDNLRPSSLGSTGSSASHARKSSLLSFDAAPDRLLDVPESKLFIMIFSEGDKENILSSSSSIDKSAFVAVPRSLVAPRSLIEASKASTDKSATDEVALEA